MNFSKLILDNYPRLTTKTALKYKEDNEWKSYSWEKFHNLIKQTANALKELGVKPEDTVAIFADNIPQWTIMDLATAYIGAVTVPIFATLTASQITYIIKEANTKVILVGDKKQYNEVLELLSYDDTIKHIITAKKSIEIKNNFTHYFYDLAERQSTECEITDRDGDDLASIIYTSGTTGEPKGVMLTHKNHVKTFDAHVEFFNLKPENENSLVFLPLSHVFEKSWSLFVLSYGGQLSYCENPREIAQYLIEVQPTTMCTVPRLFQKIHGSISDKIDNSSPFSQKMFKWAIHIGKQAVKYKRVGKRPPLFLDLKYKFADRFIFRKVKEQLGGKLWFIPVGGAAITSDITEFFDAIGIHLTIGYGLTETTATLTAFPFINYKYGTAGKPITNVQVMIGDDDEVLVKGDGIFKGYYKKPEDTAKVFTEDGWFKTGDAGKIDEEGNLIITDRIKDLMKTSNGKYIAPQFIENILTNDKYIQQAVLIGDNRSYVTALIIPDMEYLKKKAQELSLAYNNMDELVSYPAIKEFFTKKIEELQKGVASFERVKKFKLLSKDFEIESGEITPTLKIKRKIIFEKFKNIIDEMYDK